MSCEGAGEGRSGDCGGADGCGDGGMVVIECGNLTDLLSCHAVVVL